MDLLNREIVRTILGSIGFVPPPNFGKVGISRDEFMLNKFITLDFETNNGGVQKEQFAIWCGQTRQGNSTLKVLATDICDNGSNYHEFIAVYKVDNAPVHMVKHIFGEEDMGLFLFKLDTWKPVGRYEKLISCAGFEKITSMGFSWEPCKDYNDLYACLVEAIEM